VRALCLRAGDRAGVAGPHNPHRWRHSYATEMLRAGADLHVVQRLLGHTNLETTTVYLHLADQDLRRAIDRAYPSARDVPPFPSSWEKLRLDGSETSAS
jgi:site-specific recombinase XerD